MAAADEPGGMTKAYRIARRVVVFVVGMTVLLVGIIFIVTPGPAFVVIPAGLGILAIEFAWARRWLHHARDLAKKGVQSVTPSAK
jgi:tellurite resistance protein TerC